MKCGMCGSDVSDAIHTEARKIMYQEIPGIIKGETFCPDSIEITCPKCQSGVLIRDSSILKKIAVVTA